MKNFCVDLEIAKELKENRFPQKSYFRYQIDTLGEVEIETIDFAVHDHVAEVYSAPISDELLKELPKAIVNGIYWMYIIKDFDNNFQVYYENTYINELKFRIINKKLSNCLALAWLHLKKEGYIK